MKRQLSLLLIMICMLGSRAQQTTYYISTEPNNNARIICFVDNDIETYSGIHFCDNKDEADITVYLSSDPKLADFVIEKKANKKTSNVQLVFNQADALHKVHFAAVPDDIDLRIFISPQVEESNLIIFMDQEKLFKRMSGSARQIKTQQYIAAIVYEQMFKASIYQREVQDYLLKANALIRQTLNVNKEASAQMKACKNKHKEDDVKTSFSLVSANLEKLINLNDESTQLLERAKQLSDELNCTYSSADIAGALEYITEVNDVALSIIQDLNNAVFADTMNDTKMYISNSTAALERLTDKINAVQIELEKAGNLFSNCM